MTKIEFDEPSEVELNFPNKVALVITNKGEPQGDALKGMATGEKSVGVIGESDRWFGVAGVSKNHQGVHGVSESGIGVVGTTNAPKGFPHPGVWGFSKQTFGVFGESVEAIGVHGKSINEEGVFGQSDKKAGVFGQNNTGITFGVQGFSIPNGVGAILAVGGKHALVARGGTQSSGRFEGNVEVTGDIKLVNADCAEDFDVIESESKENVEAGTVMVLTENGSLQSSYQEYDKKVAGIVSGAGGYKPAIVLDKQEQNTNNKNKRLPIALMGKVYCNVDARHSSIKIGDLLTTSSTKGYAMKAEDPMKAFGV